MNDKENVRWVTYFTLRKRVQVVHPWIDEDGILRFGRKPDPAFDAFMRKALSPLPQSGESK